MYALSITAPNRAKMRVRMAREPTMFELRPGISHNIPFVLYKFKLGAVVSSPQHACNALKHLESFFFQSWSFTHAHTTPVTHDAQPTTHFLEIPSIRHI